MASGTVRGVGSFLILLPFALLQPWVGAARPTPSANDLTARVSEYVRVYDERLLAVVGEETYEQRTDARVRGRSAGHVDRRTRSTIAWVKLPTLYDTIAVREVLEVDGRVVHYGSRLRELLQAPERELEGNVKTLLNESAAYNLAPGSRNINFPTFPLVYLREPHRNRSRWTIDGRDGPHVVLSFEERRRPAIVRSEDGDQLPGMGRFWVDEATGRVDRLEFRIDRVATRPTMTSGQSFAGDRMTEIDIETSYWLSVTFAADERLGLWLPQGMEDVYERRVTNSYETVTGEARYDDYRRFETKGRLLPVVP